MTMRNAFEGLSTESMQQMMLILLAEIAEKLPRVDTADRVTANIETGTLSGVTTLGNISSVGGRDVGHVAFALGNVGATHLYNNIIVEM